MRPGPTTIQSPAAVLLAALVLVAGGAWPGGADKPAATRPAPPPDPQLILQGGDTCGAAMVIPSVPYFDAGTTVGYTDDYDEVCPFSGSTSPDVVYSFTPASAVNVDITLCKGTTDYDTKLYVYQGACPGTVTGCNDDSCSSPLYTDYVSQLTDLPLAAGETYYLVVDGYGGGAGNYTLDVSLSAVQPPNILVDSSADVLADDGLCTLREAITAANTDTASGASLGECAAGSGADRIGLPPGTYTLAIASTNEDNNLDGDLDIRSAITILGSDPRTTVVQAGPAPGTGISGVFHVVNLVGSELTLERVTVRHGVAGGFNGGGVYNERTTNVRECVITLNQAGFGGGMRNSNPAATLNILASAITNNSASGGGGGFENQQGLVNVANSTFSGNFGGGQGGGAFHTVNSSTVNVSNCTIAGNTGSGGAGGINNPNAFVYLRNTIMTNNAGGDCGGAGTFGDGNNLLDGACGGAGSLGSVTGLAATLADNGGFTPTYAIGASSNAVDAVSTCTFRSSGANPLFANDESTLADQRGMPRPQGAACDIGAFEAVGLVVNEVDSLAGEGDSREYVELWDGGAGFSDLTDHVLVLAESLGYLVAPKEIITNAVDLDGYITSADGYFVLGDAAVNPHVELGGTGTISDGAAAVALYHYVGSAADFLSIAEPPAGATLLDALVYDTGQADAPDLLPYLTPDQPQVDESAAGPADLVSNQRCPDGFAGPLNTQAYAQVGPSPHLPNYQCFPLCASFRDLPMAQWQMVSLACDPGGGASVAAVFGDDLMGVYHTDWMVWERDPVADAYVLLELDSPVSQGSSYWIFTLDSAQFFDTTGQYALTSQSFSRPLTGEISGRMNMVGNPFLFDVDAADLKVDAGLAKGIYPWGDPALAPFIDSTLWTWNGSAYQAFNGGAIPGVIPTSGGVWARVYQQPCTLLIPPLPVGAGVIAVLPPSPPPAESDGYQLRLTVTADALSDPGNYLGRFAPSVDGRDGNDLEELAPFAPPYLTLVIPHPEWGTPAWSYTTDIREPRAGAGGVWGVELRSDQAREVTLTWQLVQGAPDFLARSLLVDEESGDEVLPGELESYTLLMVGPTHRLTWRVNSLPQLDAGADREVLAGMPLHVVVSFLDEDLDDEHSASVDWGDGIAGRAVVDEEGRTVAAGHTFTVPQIQTVSFCVADQMGASACDSLTVTVLPNPAFLFADGFESGATGAWSETGS